MTLATGSCTTTLESSTPDHAVVKWHWIAGATTGSMATAVTDSAFVTPDGATKFIDGMKAIYAITVPISTPVDNYDVSINDSFGCDIFGGAMLNRSSTLTQQALAEDSSGGVFAVGRFVNTGLRLSIAGNGGTPGTGASGTVRVMFVR